MIAASLIFYAIAIFTLFIAIIGLGAVFLSGDQRKTQIIFGTIIFLLVSAGSFAVADMIWRAA